MMDNFLVEDKNYYRMRSCFKTTQTATLALSKITRILVLLVNKRATLAEKAIRADLGKCAVLESQLITSLALSFNEQTSVWDIEDCGKLRRINVGLNKQLRAFLKASAYDLNYLEQYFEHDFWLEFTNKKFVEQLCELKEKMTTMNC